MAKFAAMLGLLLATGYAALCVVSYPTSDAHFVYAAYASAVIAVTLVCAELIRLVVRGVVDGTAYVRARRIARRDAKANATLATELSKPI